jgi:uncharacterized protein YerC/predicted transcriptional regulator
LQIHQNWYDNPIVAKAIEAADGDPATALSVLSDMLNDLEAAAPGIPFSDLLATARAEGSMEARGRVAGMLLDRGLTTEEVDETVGLAGRLMLAEQLRHDGHTVRQVVAKTGLSSATIYKRQNVEIATQRIQKLKNLIASGVTISAAAKQLGISRATAHRYLNGEVPYKSPRGTREVEVGRHALEHGYKSAMAEFGISKSHALNCLANYKKGNR